MLLMAGSEVRMLDCSTGQEVWRQSISSHVFPINKVLMTDSLCILLYPKIRGSEETYTVGEFRLLVLDANRGMELHSGAHWDYAFQKEHSHGHPLPMIVADGDYACAVKTHELPCEFEVKYYMDEHQEQSFFVGMKKPKHMFVLFKLDRQSGAGQVAKFNESLEVILAAQCLKAQATTEAIGRPTRTVGRGNAFVRSEGYVKVHDLNLHGIAGRRFVVGDVRFDYFATEHNLAYTDAATAFIIDLDMIFASGDASRSAISFPLSDDMLVERPDGFGYSPYYRSCKGDIVLSGLVEFEGEENQPESAVIHSFATALEWT